MALTTTSPYRYNVTTVTREGHYIRICTQRTRRMSGWEECFPEPKAEKNSVNDVKLANNLSRARTRIRQYALCNDWDYFVTLTINAEFLDRYSLPDFIKKLSKMINNYSRTLNSDDKPFQYLLIPEKHLDGAWHMHGLISGIKPCDLVRNDNGYFTWKQYSKSFGFMSLDSVRDADKVSSYIQKYITKDLARSVNELGAHVFYHSNNLRKADTLAITDNIVVYRNPNFTNEYVAIWVFDANKEDYTNFIGNLYEIE